MRRFGIALEILNRGQWWQVLLCDSRDVFLQDAPFRSNHEQGLKAAGTAAPNALKGLVLVAEPIQIQACRINAGWVRTFFGDATLNAICGQPVLFGGTILGDQPSQSVVPVVHQYDRHPWLERMLVASLP